MAWFLRLLSFLKLVTPELRAEIKLMVDQLEITAKKTKSQNDDIAVGILRVGLTLLGLL